MASTINDFLALIRDISSIEVFGDAFISEKSGIIVSGSEMAISRTVFVELLKFSTQSFDLDPTKSSLVGCLIGSYDDRMWQYRYSLPCLDYYDEIRIVHIGLTINPKTPEAYPYLQYLVKKIGKADIKKSELVFCDKLNKKRPRNYLLWNYRSFLADFFPLNSEEIEELRQNISLYPSDHSNMYFYQTQMQKTYDNLVYDLIENSKMIMNYPGHESLWNHRRFILIHLAEHLNWPSEWKKYTIRDYIQLLPRKLSSRQLIEQQDILIKSSLNLENEYNLILCAISDNFPAEYEKQYVAACNHLKWIMCIFWKKVNCKN